MAVWGGDKQLCIRRRLAFKSSYEPGQKKPLIIFLRNADKNRKDTEDFRLEFEEINEATVSDVGHSLASGVLSEFTLKIMNKFYRTSRGIFDPMPPYEEMFIKKI